MKEKNPLESLEKCSKEELIKIIMRASDLTYATFPWLGIIAEVRLDEIQSKIDANLSEGKQLTHKFREMAENQHNYSYDEILEIRIALAKNHEKWKRMDDKYNKIFKELYG